MIISNLRSTANQTIGEMNTNSKTLLETNLKNRYNQTNQWIKDMKQNESDLVYLRKLIEDRIHNKCTDDCAHKTIYRNIDTVIYQLSESLITDLNHHAKAINKLIYARDVSKTIEINNQHVYLFEKILLINRSIAQLRMSIMKFIEDRPFEFEEYVDLNLKLDL